MKTKGRRMRRHIAGFVAMMLIVTAMSQTFTMTTYAEEIPELNAGVADAIDVIEMSEVEEAEKNRSRLFMANVENSLNVRKEPNEDASILGLLYEDCGGEVIEWGRTWSKVQSGNLVGWASNDYLLFDEEATELAESVGMNLATVTADVLHVRKEPSEEAGIYGNVENGEVYETLANETTEEWLAIDFEGDVGYISGEYVTTEFKIDHGETYEEIEEREEEERRERAKLIANLGAVAVGTTEDVLLGALVQCEAGNQCYEGQLAVAAVVMNRVRSAGYPNTVSSVIYASGQFTPAGNGKVEARVNAGVMDSCLQAARAAINGETNVGTATHFRRAGYAEGFVIQDHVFW